jgi:diguanylate cyclase (GGDEF)-like protein
MIDHTVTELAAALMAANVDNAAAISRGVLGNLVGRLGADSGFLRYNDHRARATTLVAEWPERTADADTDPLEVIYFDDAEPAFAALEFLQAALVVHPARNRQSIGAPASLVCVPLMSGGVTTGTIGLTSDRHREWTIEELGTLQTLAAMFAHLQARVAAERQLQYLSTHDEMTGLLNRQALINHLNVRLAAGAPGPVAVVHIDLDRLIAVNEHHGHGVGDRLLAAIAERLRDDVEHHVYSARVGADEFVVVPADAVGRSAACAFAKRVQALLHRPIVLDGNPLTCRASIGVAVGHPGHDSVDDLLLRAEARVAKQCGGATVAEFSNDMAAHLDLRKDIEVQLPRSLTANSNRLVLRYLPEVDLRTGQICTVEAAVGWRHPTRGLLPVRTFIGLSEAVNMAIALERYTMRAVMADFASWLSQGIGGGVDLRLRLSPTDLIEDGFLDYLAATLDEYGIDSSRLGLAIPECAVVKENAKSLMVLRELARMGVHIVIDDFGTGYNALSSLKSVPADVLKIGEPFVRDLGRNPDDLAIVRAIKDLADSFRLPVVADGVDSADAAHALLELGCHRAQGPLMCTPQDTASMGDLLADGYLPIAFGS